MENLRVVYKNEDGVAIITPTESQDIEDVISNSVPEGADYKVIKSSEIPTDREFRAAWEYMSGVNISLERAKDIQRNRWREVRGPLLEALDLDFLMASEEGDSDTINLIKQKKQILRDVTLTDLSTVNSLEELKEIWPECLLGGE